MPSASSIPIESEPLITRASRIARWGKILSRYLSLQAFIQVLGFLTGLLIIRRLAKEEYAAYAIAIATQGVMLALSDLGLGNSVLAIGGRIWQSRLELGSLLGIALRMRRILFGAASVIAGAVGVVLLVRSETAPLYGLAVVAVAAAGVLMQLDIAIYSAILRLHSRFEAVQRFELYGSAARLILVAGGLMFLRNSIYVLAAAALSAGISRHYVKRLALSLIDPRAPAAGYRPQLFKLMKAQAPNLVFYCFYGQTAILIIGLFGVAARVAEVGALSRLSAGLLIVSNLMANIVFPAFARCQDARVLFRRYHQVLLAFGCGGAMLVFLAWQFPRPVLAVLGNQYLNLERETAWMVLSAVLNGLAAVMFGFCASKGWTSRIWLTIPSIVAAQISLVFVLDLSTVKGVLIFGSLPIVPALVVYYLLALQGIKNHGNNSNAGR
jgi:O-antigen/teichoic acid export membrane protein